MGTQQFILTFEKDYCYWDGYNGNDDRNDCSNDYPISKLGWSNSINKII